MDALHAFFASWVDGVGVAAEGRCELLRRAVARSLAVWRFLTLLPDDRRRRLLGTMAARCTLLWRIPIDLHTDLSDVFLE